MDRETRNRIQRATQAARELLEHEYSEQLEGVFDIRLDGTIAAAPGEHLDAPQRVLRRKLVTAVEHQRTSGMSKADAVASYLREAAFTTLNRFVALKMLEARELVQECISRGDQSAGFKEFTGLAPGLVQLPDHGYRVYIESLFDEIGREVRVLFDRRDPANMLWPQRQRLLDLLGILNASELGPVWGEDETIGWVYQYFNSDDERKRMRAESQAPRNSRELAVRNQFFTPRYVVQFLTDNTLGRTWYEMRQGDTRLSDLVYLVRRQNEVFLAEGEAAPAVAVAADAALTEEGLSQRPSYVPFRGMKDPRDIRVLDPACGSGHFLLYAFDVLLAIYEEAWADHAAPRSAVTGRTLRDDYASIESLRAALPGLILRHNLYGIDIDARCAQIAALALWMRAQRAYKGFGISRDSRLAIQKTNIVVAEPMPGEPELRREFVATLDPKLAKLVERVFERMELAGEAGSLLRMQTEISDAVRKAYGVHGALFSASDEERWLQAEEDVRSALRVYAERASDEQDLQRRLFAEDAARGLGFIDLCTHRYDVVVMNPPFGKPTPNVEAVLRTQKSNGWKDIYAGFLEVAARLAGQKGFVGAITSSQYFHTRQLRTLREEWVKQGRISCLVDLGAGVLDGAAVQTALAVLGPRGSVELVYLDLFEQEEKASQLLAAVDAKGFSSLSLNDLEMLPGIPFCLHASPNVLHQWRVDMPFDPHSGTVATGNHTFDDERFLRLRFEVQAEMIGSSWRTFEKGGEYHPFFASPQLVVQWNKDGAELRAVNVDKYGSDAQVMQSSKLWGKRGVCYTHVSSIGFSPRLLPPGIVFSSESIGIFPKVGDGDPTSRLLALLAFLGSTAAQELIWVFGRYRKIENRAVSGLPISFTRLEPLVGHLAQLARKAIDLSMAVQALDETTAVFRLPDLLVDESAQGTHRLRLADQLNALYSELDRSVESLLGLTDDDLTAPRRSTLVPKFALERVGRSPEERASDAMMWAVGRAFGRWSSNPISTSLPDLLENQIPPFPPAAVTDKKSASMHAILVDDEGHESDLCSRALSCLEAGPADAAVEAVTVNLAAASARSWVRSRLFDHHLRRYSAFKRRAPIYWQLATPSASYSVWLYHHRSTRDTLYRVLNDYVTPKLQHEQRKITSLTQDAGPTPSARQRKEIDLQDRFALELQVFQKEVERVTPLWNPNLNDGVIINFAPLWRLVPQHRAWQKECKATWDRLCKGDYDWAHLAMHLWPERVVPKCVEDRSLAIAHGLEDVFWYKDSAGKWQPRKVSESDVAKLVKERTSAAVKDALNSLLEAPAPATGRATRKKSPRAKGTRKGAASARSKAAADGSSASGRSPATVDAELLSKVKDAIGSIGDGSSKADVIDATGISASQWNKAIKALLADGTVTQTGERSGARYHLGGGDA